MISIIVCSRDPELFQFTEENVNNTIGVPFEIIRIDNRIHNYGICKAYNIGASKSKYDILCFMHEDLAFHSSNWGKVVEEVLADKKIGLLGIIGGSYKSKIPSGWWSIRPDLKRMKVLQMHPPKINPDYEYQNPLNETLPSVVNADGLWLCTRKDVWEQFKFDEIHFKEFHFYDLDFSMQILQKYRICITYDILVEHKSLGNVNASWVNNAFIFNKKWEHLLPVSTLELSKQEKDNLEYAACKEFTFRLIMNKFKASKILQYLLLCISISPFDRDNYWLIKYWIKNR